MDEIIDYPIDEPPGKPGGKPRGIPVGNPPAYLLDQQIDSLLGYPPDC